MDSDGNVKRSRLGVVVESELNPTSSNDSTLGNRIAQTVKDTLPMNAVTEGKESIPVFAGFNNRKPVSSGVFASTDGRNQGISLFIYLCVLLGCYSFRDSWLSRYWLVRYLAFVCILRCSSHI